MGGGAIYKSLVYPQAAGGRLEDSIWVGSVSVGCFHRRLTPVAGDASLSELPIDGYRADVACLLHSHSQIGVRSPPGSGKTLGLPAMLLDWSPACREAVLLVEPTQYAAQKLVDSFCVIQRLGLAVDPSAHGDRFQRSMSC